MAWNDALYRALTGGQQPPGGLTDVVRSLGGTRAVAEQQGVSQRTVQRWITSAGQRRTASPSTRTALTGAQRSRAAWISAGLAQGGSVTIGGMQGPRGYERERTITTDVDGETLAAIRDAWSSGDDETARELLEGAIGDSYLEGWHVTVDMDALDFS